MTNSNQTAALAVMTDIRAVERSRMASVRAAAQLVVTMTEAHEQLGSEFYEGQPELLRASQMVAAEAQLNPAVAKLHRELSVFALRRGIDLRMAGDVGNTNFDDLRKELLALGEKLPDLSGSEAITA